MFNISDVVGKTCVGHEAVFAMVFSLFIQSSSLLCLSAGGDNDAGSDALYVLLSLLLVDGEGISFCYHIFCRVCYRRVQF